ncbi:microtubule-associated tumor suppressor 1 homolog isoform X2 [Anabas testudineus]|uniref:Microtubule associated tumor suppressor 1b n=1 Tax=Anabas testudineus TaxID=64144 RepID=A0A3Q1H4A9_ANATE|nr:microtubule-associated tumor suppressor 1 homolog isoform X2 [Anabas testudineus]
MSMSEPSEGFPMRGKGGSSMRLSLHSAGDHNGNAFPISSSSSSSSSPCLGESSPESHRSLSSLSGGRTDSPLDYDILEVTVMTAVLTEMNKVTDVVISKWTSEEDGKQDNVEKMQVTELSESNDNSVSIYLDASSGEYHQDKLNDNDLTQAQSLTTSYNSHDNEDDPSSGRGRRHGSTTPDSDATEIPADEDDDGDEDTLFLSLSSDMGVQRSSVPLTSSVSQSRSSLTIPGEFAVGPLTVCVATDGRSEACPLDLSVDSQPHPPASEDNIEIIPKSSPHSLSNQTHDSKEASSPAVGAERCAVVSKPTQPHTGQPARAAKNKPTNATSTATKTLDPTFIKPSAMEAKRVTNVDLKNVRVKVESPKVKSKAVSPSKTPSQQNKSSPVKKAFPRKDTQTGDGGKRQRSSAGPVKLAVVLKPVRGKSSNLKTHCQTVGSGSAQPVISRTLSTSTSSLGSEMVEERSLDAPRKPVREVPDKCGETESVKTAHPSDNSAKEATREALTTHVVVEKPKDQRRKVSKLGPNARQHGKGTREHKVGPVSSAECSTLGSPGPRQAQMDGSVLGESGQNAGVGSPIRVRTAQNQTQGIPKSRTTADRTSAQTDQATTAITKPTANQNPALGSTGRPAATAASKLPVKGLPTSLSSLTLGSNENNGATSKASAGVSAPTGTKPDERPSRCTLTAGSQGATRPPSSSTATTTSNSTPSEAVTSVNSNIAAPSKPPAMRSRALSLQARTTATGLRAPATNHNNSKMAVASQTAAKTAPAASQGLVKQASQYPLQRSGSARLSRLNSTVDKNKPREAPARPTNANGSSQVAPAGGTNQNQLQPPPDLVADVVNKNAPVTPLLPVPVTEITNTGSSIPGHAFKARTGSRSSPKSGSRIHSASKPAVAGAVVTDGTIVTKQNQSKELAEKKNQAINQLRKLLIQGNRRVEALATVIQHLFSEREEALKQKKELSLELENLRAELVASSQCYERLQKEKEEVRVSFETALKRQEQQHKEELVQLEDRLRCFYQTEWDKVHQKYQEEADKCRMLMEQQVEELRSRQEAERKNQEVMHTQEMDALKQQYKASIQELKSIQQTDLEKLEKNLKETESSLSEKISELSAEREALNEKLQAEEERRKRLLTDKNLKDSHTLYLEQELESLKVVLEIKNNNLHQKEKKLMEMDKLVETNVKLEECLKKVQQENEDYKARMDKHAALSKQLSTEQAILQQTLQKESKVNKRLSMENEELLWKLHNGDLLGSPRRLSPTSPFSSPRNSASFPTTASLSPR